jgi:hypothetical protein
VTPDLRVDAGEGTVTEHGIAEQIRRRHRDLESGGLQRRLEVLHDRVTLRRCRVAGDEVVVVKVHTVGAELGELVHDLHGADLRPRRFAEGIASGVAHRPEAEREVVLRLRGVCILCR